MKDHRPMQFCKECEADAFVKCRMGSRTILDCGHDGDTGALIAARRQPVKTSRKKRGGPTAREVWAAHQAKQGRPTPTPISGRFSTTESNIKEVDKPAAPPRHVATFDSTAASRTIGDLLKRRDK